MRQLGYSTPVLNQLSLSRLPTSNRTYESKWRLFESFCRERSVDAFTASPAVVADFLLWVASARSASYSTLAGYRSALGHVLRLSTGYCPGTCPVLAQLMQSFKRTQPRPSNRVPQWDINLVLSVLCEGQFADDRLSLDILTAKTVFLLALASGERRSALAALAYPPQFDESHMSIRYHRDFIPKSYFVRKNVTSLAPIRIPFVSEDSCVQVCPCRTTLFYLDVVAARRAVHSKTLFLHHSDNPRPLTPQAVARYIIKLVQWTYEQAGASPPLCRAHDVRKVAASMRALTGESLSGVLEAGQWSSPFTFLKHYLVSVGRGDAPAPSSQFSQDALLFRSAYRGKEKQHQDHNRRQQRGGGRGRRGRGGRRGFQPHSDKAGSSSGRPSESVSHAESRRPPTA